MLYFLAQATVAPIDWNDWSQFGLGALLAGYLLVYAMPRAQDKNEASLKAVVADFKEICREEREARKEEMRLIRETFECRAV